MAEKREIKESPVRRGVGEEFAYSFSLTPWPTGSYTNPAVEIFLTDTGVPTGTDLSGTLLTGAASVATSTFTTPKFVADAATVGELYRLFWTVDIDSDEWGGWLDIGIDL